MSESKTTCARLIHPRWRCRILITAITALCALSQWWVANASGVPREYELEGTIHQISFTSSGSPQIELDGVFKIYVSDCKWLIQTIEYVWTPRTESSLKREIGSTNGTEIVEIVTPLETVIPDTNAPPGDAFATAKRSSRSRLNTATIVASAVPVGQLDGSVVGHLWLMLASQCYLSGLTTNLLTPVFDVSASAPGNPNLKNLAEWELINGVGSLPKNVTYFEHKDRPRAIYRVTGETNVNGVAYPTGFTFEQYRGDVTRVRKQATAVVTAIRPVCSIASLLPAVTQDALVVDRRLAQAEQPEARITYRAKQGTALPAATELREIQKINNPKKSPPNRSPIMLALLGTALVAPLVFFGIHHWKHRKRQ